MSEPKGVIGESVWVLGGIALVARLNPDSKVESIGGRGESAGCGAGCRKVQEWVYKLELLIRSWGRDGNSRRSGRSKQR